MPIKGSFHDHKSLNKANIEAMCRETASESGEGLKEDIQDATPKDTGRLREGWEESEVKKVYPNKYRVEVKNEVPYVRHVEYGTGPHKIAADGAQALYFGGRFVDHVMHPGSEGSHMAVRGAAMFEKSKARAIAEKNARKYLD